jgi:hypothetical protein
MPKILTFALCGRVIIDGNNIVTLVELMQGLGVNVPSPVSMEKGLPKNAVAPQPWSVFSIWKPEPDDPMGEPFFQVTQVLLPDGSEFNRSQMEMRFAPGKNHQITVNFNAFPIGQPGDVVVNIWAERNAKRVGEVSTWIVPVTHVTAPSRKN